MTDKTFVLHLNGFPGTGKLTTAQEIAKWENVRLIDNHAINNPIFILVRGDSKEKIPEDAWAAIRQIRKIVLDGMITLARPELSFVMTNCLAKDDENDEAIYAQIQNAAAESGRAYIPVILTCDLAENQRRIMDAGREKNMKMRDTDGLARMREEFALLGQDHPNALVLDVTKLQPHESAKHIRRHVEQVLRNNNRLIC